MFHHCHTSHSFCISIWRYRNTHTTFPLILLLTEIHNISYYIRLHIIWTTAHVCYFWRKTKTASGTVTNASPINKAQKRSFVSPSDCNAHTIQETGNIYRMTKSLNIHWDVRPWQPIWMSSNCCPLPPLVILLFFFICAQIDCLKMRTAEALSAE